MRNILLLTGLLISCAAPTFAQQPAATPPAPTLAQSRGQATPPRPAAPPGSLATQVPPAPPTMPVPTAPQSDSTQNISVEVTITDTTATPQKKTVTMLMADGRNSRVRANSDRGSVLNIDANAHTTRDGRMMLGITFDYMPANGSTDTQPHWPLNEMLTVIVADGKPLVVSQSADPSTDRKVTVEVTATIVK